MAPNLQLDDRTACEKGNTKAAEISLNEVDGTLIATGLNLDLGELAGQLTEHADLPLLVLADTVRVRQPVRLNSNSIHIEARKIRTPSGAQSKFYGTHFMPRHSNEIMPH